MAPNPRALGRPGELRSDADIPDHAGREPVPQAELRPDGGRVAKTERLLGEDVADQGGRVNRGAPSGCSRQW